MKLSAITAPPERRTQAPGEGGPRSPSPLMRWVGISIRTAHIGVASVFFGGLVLGVAATQLPPWHHLTLLTGGLLLALEWRHDRYWPHRGKGLLGLLHLSLGLLIHLCPGLTQPLLWGILISGGVGSHMPRRFRHWSLLHGWENTKR